MNPLDRRTVEGRLAPLLEALRKRGSNGRGETPAKSNPSLTEDLGFDSIEVLQLILKIEAEFGLTVPDDYLRGEYFETVESISELVLKLLAVEGAGV